MRFRILGTLEVLDSSGWRSVGTSKGAVALATLLVHAGEVVSIDHLSLALWGDTPPKSATTQVHGYIMRLRKLLDDRDGSQVQTVAPGYRLRLGEDDLDAAVFEAREAEGRGILAAGDPARAAEILSEALSLWRGPALCGVPTSETVEAEADRLAERRLGALESRIDADLECGRHAVVITELRRHIDQNPTRERARRQLMVALYRSGRQAEALEEFRQTRRLLINELGAEPGPALQDVHQRILAGDHELLVPETVVQGPVQPTPVHQLPADIEDFTGRTDHVDELVAALTQRAPDGPPTVVVVHGAPGTGKSALGVRAARMAAKTFPDGQLYLDLSGSSSTTEELNELLADILRTLGVTGSAVPSGLQSRAALYRSLLAERRMLILLDSAATVEQVRWLLPPDGQCALVVTSRQVLTGLPGARRIELRELSAAEAYDLLGCIVGSERVAREPQHAEAIARLCGHLPLAIRIAGGKLLGRPTWSLGVLRNRLEDETRRLSELQLGDLGVRASVDLSLDLLAPEAVRAFGLLGLLGTPTLPEWVLAPLLDRDNADSVLDALVDANLVRPIVSDANDEPRYQMHDLLRACAAESAAGQPPAEVRAAIGRLLATWLGLLEAATQNMPPSLFRPPRGTAPRRTLPEPVVRRLVEDPLPWFDTEREALMGAVRLATEWDLPDLAWELAASAAPFYDHRALHEDWRRSHQLALSRVGGDRLGEGVLRHGLGQVDIYRVEFDAAASQMSRALDLFRQVGYPLGEALALAGGASVARQQGRYDEALETGREALAVARAAKEHHLAAQLSSAAGVLLLALDRHAEATVAFEEALAGCRAIGDQHREAVIMRELSQLHHALGESMTALDHLSRALAIFVDLDDDRCVAYTLLHVGRIHVDLGERPKAVAALTRAGAIFRRNSAPSDEARCQQLLGELEAKGGNADGARRHWMRTMRLWQSVGADQEAAEVQTQLISLDL
ncbi:AfsR/SARP family transcriptional regulator [Luteipulveratus mongoliensis]|uniref:OmpR/PhoB-type domain-containing protein n=1 Tax=Luteipulveratus mongoliensis TaxID=571913 RepID=A0A0K1JF14_9MICO|nr:BTAD domain-containing putative transcriptional regulator [Luteipulveratus mongoliensis]AKU15307.1 hypothetical protein VV02_04590 [Luteipulveratus mongoliensis]